MKYTLLELVQTILSSMGSDEVESITDTGEAEQVAKIIKDVYFDLVSDEKLPEHQGLFDIQGAGDTTNPTKLIIPSDVVRVLTVKYDKSTDTDSTDRDFQNIHWCDPTDFLDRVMARDATSSDIQQVSIDGTYLLIRNDRFPEFYTSFDDDNITMDAFNSTYDNTLQGDKCLGWGYLSPTWSMTDSFTPDLDASQFALLRNEAKAMAFYELKSQVHERSERKSRRQGIIAQKDRSKFNGTPGLWQTPNYGRR